MQDSAGEPETGDPVRHRLVPSPSAPSGQGSARSAHETIAGALQLLRRERQLSQSAADRRGDEAGLVQVVVSSQPAPACHLGTVRGSSRSTSTPASPDHGPNLGPVTTSRLHRGAGWWKSPCPDLERARVGNCPGLLDSGFSGGSDVREPPVMTNPRGISGRRHRRGAERYTRSRPPALIWVVLFNGTGRLRAGIAPVTAGGTGPPEKYSAPPTHALRRLRAEEVGQHEEQIP